MARATVTIDTQSLKHVAELAADAALSYGGADAALAVLDLLNAMDDAGMTRSAAHLVRDDLTSMTGE